MVVITQLINSLMCRLPAHAISSKIDVTSGILQPWWLNDVLDHKHLLDNWDARWRRNILMVYQIIVSPSTGKIFLHNIK